MSYHKTSTPTLVSALRILAGEIHSDDGVANMTIAEAADRIEELVGEIERWRRDADVSRKWTVNAELRADLARVTNERREYWRERLIADGALVSSEQLRTRVAELELDRQALFERSVKLGDRAAELVAALRELHTYPADRAVWESAGKVLARAESATPAVVQESLTTESATPGLRTDNPMAEPVMGGLPRYDGEKLGTPAKHPDTVRLEWLFGNTIIAGPDGHVIDCRDELAAAMKGTP